MKRTIRALAAIVVIVVVLLPSRPSAHDIPADTTVRMFIKPDGQRLHMLVRVQMASINDIDWPTHKDGYLDLPRIDQFLRDAAAMWISDYIDVYEGSRKLSRPDIASVRLATDGDPSFGDSYDAAVAHLTGPRIPDDTNLFPLQGLLDVMFDYPIESPESNFSINPRFDRLGLHVTTVLKFLRPNGAVRSFEYAGLPGLVRLDPEWHEAAWRFMQMGFFHFLDGSAPLMFLFCLVIPFRRVRELIPVVVAFAVAHSVTLLASAAYHMEPDVLWFPPLVNTLIAVSIFYVALENIVGLRAEGQDPTTKTLARRWMIALAFGLVYGFGFALALGSMLQFAGSHATVSILSFNLGIEIGLIFVLALMVPAIELAFRFVADERIGTIVVSAIVAHTAWHTMADRYAELRRYPFRWPPLDLMFLASALRWMMVAVVLAAAVWLIGLLRETVAPDGTQLTRGVISRSQK
jgi:hypothetical protein